MIHKNKIKKRLNVLKNPRYSIGVDLYSENKISKGSLCVFDSYKNKLKYITQNKLKIKLIIWLFKTFTKSKILIEYN